MIRKSSNSALPKDEIIGFRISDLFGILIMVIPFIISIYFRYDELAARFLGIPMGADKTIRIRPHLISASCSMIFYASLVVRYKGVFRRGTMVEAIISCIRTILNCWVIAALIEIPLLNTELVTTKDLTLSVLFKTPGSTLLLIAILLSWLGMKTIAGYSWILFIVAAWKNMNVVNDAMGMWGAIFILTFALSLFLQVKDYSVITEFMSDFRTYATKYEGEIKQEISMATDDAVSKISSIGDKVKESITIFTDEQMDYIAGGENEKNKTKIDLVSLDINKDGIVNDKDFKILIGNKRENME